MKATAQPRAQLKPAPNIYLDSRRAVHALYIAHPNFEATLDDVIDRMNDHVSNEGSHESLLVSGFPGAGKTTLITKILEAYPRAEDSRRFTLEDGTMAVCDYVPVLAIECPSKPSEKEIVQEFLKKLKDPFAENRNLRPSKDALKRYLRAGGTLVIIVDEAHRPTDRRGKIIQRSIATLFQQLHEWGYIVLLVGLARAEALLEEDTQVERRWGAPLRLEAYNWGDLHIPDGQGPLSRYEFMGMLIAVVGAVSLDWSPDIDFNSEDHAFRFYYASRGLIGYLKKLVFGLLRIAKRRKETVITWAILAQAFPMQFRMNTKEGRLQNPFTTSFIAELPPPPPDDRADIHPEQAASHRRGPHSRTKKERRADLTQRLTLK